ncbi:plasmid replication protein RepC [Sinorhizobium psoraleae]|uniref:Plasmid replication protein RepC n=1 Tax=Sinorhizobium psoraleae TaxID=520838 RepID=A0ABT4KCQ4_9HYPH|nr:plasmid replication protein RepC [Sinorhizobium psoraleae]MCZ4088767.1 plasmid replication protein RepC [Sinorhizobium psoraleae]
MESGNVTTPFGRRPMTLALLASQFISREIQPGRSADKWKLFRALCEAKPRLGVSERALAVLNALLSFYPENTLSEEAGLVVFPSNAQLSLRAHGMAEATLRRHLVALVEAGLVTRKDSPNGKRYARKSRNGSIDEAFGFSLAPLLARADEVEQLAAEVKAERLELRRLRERLTLCRRDIAKLIEVAIDEAVPGNWTEIQANFNSLVTGIPRTPSIERLGPIVEKIEKLREAIANELKTTIKSPDSSGNPDQNERHIQSSEPESLYESEPRSGDRPVEESNQAVQPASKTNRSFPLAMVLKACPEIVIYGPGGTIRSWPDLMTAAVTVRTMLRVDPSAYQDACQVLGPENAATLVACILERAEHITSAGGYLRDLTGRARRGVFSIGPMLMCLMRTNQGAGRKTG